MYAVSERCVLLNPPSQLVQEGYREHVKLFTAAQLLPYGQQAAGGADSAPGRAAGSGGEEAAEEAATELAGSNAGAVGDPAADSGQQRRKRRRKSSYQPNPAEEAANARAAEAAPLLQAALDALHGWMAARQCSSLLQLCPQVGAIDSAGFPSPGCSGTCVHQGVGRSLSNAAGVLPAGRASCSGGLPAGRCWAARQHRRRGDRSSSGSC